MGQYPPFQRSVARVHQCHAFAGQVMVVVLAASVEAGHVLELDHRSLHHAVLHQWQHAPVARAETLQATVEGECIVRTDPQLLVVRHHQQVAHGLAHLLVGLQLLVVHAALNSMVLSWLIWLLNCQAPTEMPRTVSRGATALLRSQRAASVCCPVPSASEVDGAGGVRLPIGHGDQAHAVVLPLHTGAVGAGSSPRTARHRRRCRSCHWRSSS
jgi:hypothetical protein